MSVDHNVDVQYVEGRYKPRLHVSVNLLAGVWPPSCATPTAVVLRTRQRAIPLAMITTRNLIQAFPLLSYMGRGSVWPPCEKLWILTTHSVFSLNTKPDLITKCHHGNKFLSQHPIRGSTVPTDIDFKIYNWHLFTQTTCLIIALCVKLELDLPFSFCCKLQYSHWCAFQNQGFMNFNGQGDLTSNFKMAWNVFFLSYLFLVFPLSHQG